MVHISRWKDSWKNHIASGYIGTYMVHVTLFWFHFLWFNSEVRVGWFLSFSKIFTIVRWPREWFENYRLIFNMVLLFVAQLESFICLERQWSNASLITCIHIFTLNLFPILSCAKYLILIVFFLNLREKSRYFNIYGVIASYFHFFIYNIVIERNGSMELFWVKCLKRQCTLICMFVITSYIYLLKMWLTKYYINLCLLLFIISFSAGAFSKKEITN